MQKNKMVKQKERPILFGLPMVQAILDSRKTMTRRVVKLHKKARWGTEYDGQVIFDDGSAFGHEMAVDEMRCPYGAVGDRIWVRENWSVPSIYDKQKPSDMDADYAGVVRYKANGYQSGKLRPSLFMPRWASRILLEITNVRVERLRDISEQDAIAEGIGFDVVDQALFFKNYMSNSHFADDDFCNMDDPEAAKKSYFSLWESINGRESLEANPFVWVIEFKRVGGAT